MSDQNFDQENDDEENNQLNSFINELYRCYEENGFLRTLAGQVRNQMFSILENLDMNSNFEAGLNQFFKLPIIGLLVAEFLLQIKCFSTLLSFKNEKANLKNVQNFIENVGELSDKLGLEPIGTIRLKEPDVVRLLENMGIRPEIAAAIITLYYSSNEESLLTCILQVLINGKQKQQQRQSPNSSLDDQPSTSSGNEKKEMSPLSFCLKCKEMDLNKERVETELKHFENVLKQKEKHLAELALNLKQQHDVITQRLEHVEDNSQVLKNQEKEINEMKTRESIRLQERKSELFLKQQQLDLEFRRLKKERASMVKVRAELEDTKRQLEIVSQSLVHSRSEVSFLKDLQLQCVFLRDELEATKKKLDHKPRIQEQQEDLEDSLLQTIVRQLRQENHDLRNQTQLQKLRIEDLEGNTERLNQRLTEAIAYRGTITAPTLLDAPTPRRAQQPLVSPGQERQLGSGEVLNSTINGTRHHYPRYRSLVSREIRRRPPQRIVIQTENSSDESSLTEDILVEARMRLRKLEEESAAVDRNFRNFRIRQATAAPAPTTATTKTFNFNYQKKSPDYNYQLAPTNDYHRKKLFFQDINSITTTRKTNNDDPPSKMIATPFLPYSELAHYNLPLLSSSDGLDQSKPSTFDSYSSDNSRRLINQNIKPKESSILTRTATKEKEDNNSECGKKLIQEQPSMVSVYNDKITDDDRIGNDDRNPLKHNKSKLITNSEEIIDVNQQKILHSSNNEKNKKNDTLIPPRSPTFFPFDRGPLSNAKESSNSNNKQKQEIKITTKLKEIENNGVKKELIDQNIIHDNNNVNESEKEYKNLSEEEEKEEEKVEEVINQSEDVLTFKSIQQDEKDPTNNDPEPENEKETKDNSISNENLMEIINDIKTNNISESNDNESNLNVINEIITEKQENVMINKEDDTQTSIIRTSTIVPIPSLYQLSISSNEDDHSLSGGKKSKASDEDDTW